MLELIFQVSHPLTSRKAGSRMPAWRMILASRASVRRLGGGRW